MSIKNAVDYILDRTAMTYEQAMTALAGDAGSYYSVVQTWASANANVSENGYRTPADFCLIDR